MAVTYHDSKTGEPLTERSLVIVTDFDMPFMGLVAFMVKAALASIPAALIIGFLYFAIVLVLGGLLHALVAPR